MRKIARMLLPSFAICMATAWADSGWSIQRLLLTTDARYPIYLNGVAMLEGGKFGIAVGGRQGVPGGIALVATTDDGGRHWEWGNIDDGHGGLSKVVFIDQTTAIAVGGLIFHTTDRGRTWMRVSGQSAS